MGLFGSDSTRPVVDHPGLDAPATDALQTRPSWTRMFGQQPVGHSATKSRSVTPRMLQFLVAVLILALVAYALHVYSETFLQSAYIPAIVAAVLTILATPIAAIHRLPGKFSHPLAAALVDLFFALLWLAIMTELAAYSDVSSPTKVTYYTGTTYGQTNAAYVRYAGTIGRLKRAWACGAAAAAFAALEFVLFLVSALLPLRGSFQGKHFTGQGTDDLFAHGHIGLDNHEMWSSGNCASPTRPVKRHVFDTGNTDNQAFGHERVPKPSLFGARPTEPVDEEDRTIGTGLFGQEVGGSEGGLEREDTAQAGPWTNRSEGSSGGLFGKAVR